MWRSISVGPAMGAWGAAGPAFDASLDGDTPARAVPARPREARRLPRAPVDEHPARSFRAPCRSAVRATSHAAISGESACSRGCWPCRSACARRCASTRRWPLERLLRCCARPCWSPGRLTQADDGERLVYAFDKPRPDRSWQVTLTPLEPLDRLARFIPPPRRHLHRYHGVFAPHATLRARVTARAGEAIAVAITPTPGSVTSIPAPITSGAPAVAENLADAIRARLGLSANIRPLSEPSAPASPGARWWARMIASSQIRRVAPQVAESGRLARSRWQTRCGRGPRVCTHWRDANRPCLLENAGR